MFLAKESVRSAYFKVGVLHKNPCRFHAPPVSESRPTLSVKAVLYNFPDYLTSPVQACSHDRTIPACEYTFCDWRLRAIEHDNGSRDKEE